MLVRDHESLDDIIEGANHQIATEIAGLDALDLAGEAPNWTARRLWSTTWPKLAAATLAIALWQAVVLSGWRERYILPGPDEVFPRLWEELQKGTTWDAIATTMRRAVTGFGIALVIGTAIGIAVSTFKVVRTAVGSMITGLQTMPSVTWFPLALVLFQQSEAAIFFVIVLGAAPSIANGLITGVDNIPPLLTRVGRVLGAGRIGQIRHVVLPGALPTFVGGLKQGWAFAWRSLLAGELIVIIANKPSIGSRLEFERQFSDYPALLALMIIILVIGVLVDSVIFSGIDRRIRRGRGLLPAT